MKRIFLTLVFIGFLAYFLSAKQINIEQAQKVGLAYYYEHAGQFVHLDFKTLKVTNIFTEAEENIPIYYIININSNAFVIVSANDVAKPVLGYSYESSLDPSKMPPALKYWLDGIKKGILWAVENNIPPDAEIQNEWDYYLNITPENLRIKKSKAVEPLLTSTWNQDKYYNQFCPPAPGGPDDKAYAGCVATAMGQIMYYYRFPTTGQGTHGGINLGATTYYWDNMLDNLGNYNEAVATLLYHCGVTVNMNYSATGSGAMTYNVPGAVKDHFRYNSTCAYASKYLYTDANWITLLKNNLDAKHPLVYSGSDATNGGHAWNCDGYDASNNFHMNWGWSGYANGFYAISNLVAGGYNFAYDHGVVHNFYPPTTSYPSYCTGTRNVPHITGTIEDGSGPNDYTNNNDCYWLISPNETVTKITLSFIQFDTETGNDIVTIYDGGTTSAPVLATYSGSTLPADVTSTGPQMLVRFQTNGNTTKPGWKAMYRSSFPTYCSGITTLTSPSGTITDGSGADNYSYNHLCRWSIAPPNATQITINFTEFNLASNDYVKIYNQNTNTELNTYTGTNLPQSQTYNTSKIMILFKTDGYLNAGGFTLNYTSDGAANIEDYENYYKLNIYPNPATSNINVEFFLNDAENISVELCSITGQILFSETLSKFSGKYLKTFSTESLNKGVYLIKITTEKQSFYKKIIIQ